jgi:hypothetical protein
MKRAFSIGIVREPGLRPPAPRRTLGLAITIACAVAALSFTLGLMR